MTCPNCQHKLKTVSMDNQTVRHCSRCGGSFFEENGINRITLSSALKLARDKKVLRITGETKECPIDDTPMPQIRNEELIPAGVALHRCPVCRGIFTYPDDLLRFKRAQKVKLQFFKLWGKPLPSTQTILVLSFLSVVSASLVASLITTQQEKGSYSQAAELIVNPTFTNYNGALYISFTTRAPATSQIDIIDQDTHEIISRTINDHVSTVHLVSIQTIDLSHRFTYQITLTDAHGKTVKTKEAEMKVK